MRWGRSARAGVRADLSLQAGRARLRQQFSIGPARAGPTRESALASARASAPAPAISESTCVHSIATKDGSCMHAYTLSLSGSSYELLWTSRKPTVSYNERYHVQSTEGDLEFWSRPCGEPLPPPVLEEMRMFRPLSKALTTTSRSLHRSRQLFDDTGGWYGQPLRATTILSVRKQDKVVSEKLPLPRAHAPNDRRDPRAVHHRRWPGLSGLSHCEAQCQKGAAAQGGRRCWLCRSDS